MLPLPPLPPKLSSGEQRLLRAFRALDGAGRAQLTDFAEFLGQRLAQGDPAENGVAPEPPAPPKDIPRPPEESVVAAMRRLSTAYFMLERDLLLHEAADLMSAHLVQGRPATDVIDDLERLFEQTYQRTVRDMAE